MSYWTHIVGAFDVNTYIESDTVVEEVYEIMREAPKITGSERDAHIYVNLLIGHNVFTSKDCKRCKYGDGLTDWLDECAKPQKYKCPSGEYQTRVIIGVHGDLRDRFEEQTKAEWETFCKFVEEKFYVSNYSCNIIGYDNNITVGMDWSDEE